MMFTQALLHEIFHYDPETGVFRWKKKPICGGTKVGDVAGYITHRGYVEIKCQGTTIGAHRVAWLYVTGALPPEELDHVNGLRNDNRWDNLRLATPLQNSHNRKRRRDNTSGRKGVHWDAKNSKWRARITIDGKERSLGSFLDIEEAAMAYASAAADQFGEFARLA